MDWRNGELKMGRLRRQIRWLPLLLALCLGVHLGCNATPISLPGPSATEDGYDASLGTGTRGDAGMSVDAAPPQGDAGTAAADAAPFEGDRGVDGGVSASDGSSDGATDDAAHPDGGPDAGDAGAEDALNVDLSPDTE